MPTDRYTLVDSIMLCLAGLRPCCAETHRIRVTQRDSTAIL